MTDDARVPLQNRVTPTGDIVSNAGRGRLMGNRGCLHGQGRELGTTRWRSKLWICCVLEWNGWQRDPMPPGRWTALFFLDEATALAAGHRPCAYCRRGDFLDFAGAWRVAEAARRRPWAAEMDTVLHGQRVTRVRRKVTYRRPADRLPDGVMVRVDGMAGLILAGRMRPWSFEGYLAAVDLPAEVEVLTPAATVAAIASGYRPMVHPSALAADTDTLRSHGPA